MAKFFIERPIFAWVIAIVIMVAGGLSILKLPISQYPAVAPPAITVAATYPGASADTLDQSVTQVIEQKMSGLNGLRYISSTSDSSGAVSIELTFEPGTDADIAQVQVQNKLQLAVPQLPQEVQRLGVVVSKSNRNFLLIPAFISSDGSMTRNDTSDYVASHIQDALSRVPGVGDIQAFGAPYAMQVWLNPERLRALALTPLDVSAAILLRVNPDGSHVRLGDVARVELTGESFDIETAYNGKPATGLAIRLAAGANALDTAAAIKQRIGELSESFPPGLVVEYPIDSTPFVRISIRSVVETLIEAIVLVFLVMLLFLQRLRATLIPTIAVPVVLLGTFGVLAAFGYSINTLTMFGLVLAIGLLVDDAIVVVENVERVMHDDKLSPKEATKKSMEQITGALVGIAMVLAAVFVPMAFFSGSIGVIYRQFAVTLVAAMALSVVVALTLTPALTSTLLRPGHGGTRRGLFGLFNRGYDRTSSVYQRVVTYLVRRKRRALVGYLALVGVLVALYGRMPTGFLPEEDQGQLYVQALLPVGSTQEQTGVVLDRVARYLTTTEHDAVEGVFVVNGFSFSGRGQNAGIVFIKLRPWDERKTARLKASEIAKRAMGAFVQYSDALVFAFGPPAITELGQVGGFQLELLDRGGIGHDALLAARNQLFGMIAKEPLLTKVRPGGLEDQPTYKLEVDPEKASALGLSLGEINTTLASAWGGSYINDFVDKGRTKRVYMRADAEFRMQPADLDRWYVRNRDGQMVSFSAFATGRWSYGSPRLERFNGYPAMAIQGEPAAGVSSGAAMAALESLVKRLPPGVGSAWSGLSYEERDAGSGTLLLYGLSLLVVFLCLAALYESWSVPISVLLVVPLGVLGAVLATLGRGLVNNVYFQVGLLATIGLGAKNAILIVEFAKQEVERGRSAVEAAIDGARLRLRPIIMTSLAFILGVTPLALANGAGAGGQNAIGVAIIGGVAAATMLGVLLVPVFFVLIVHPRPASVPTAYAIASEVPHV